MMREMDDLDELFEQLFSRDVEVIHHVHHPSTEVLRGYLWGRLSRRWRGPEGLLSDLGGEWRHQEVSTHLLACRECQSRLHALQMEVKRRPLWRPIREVGAALRERLGQVPHPALATIAVQSFLIVGLTGLLLLQPAPLFPRAVDEALPTAVIELPQEEATPPPSEAEELPEPITQAIQTLTEDSNPQSRLSAAQLLRKWSDPRLMGLMEPLIEVYEHESHPKVREELAQVLSSIWVHTEGHYLKVARSLRRLLEREHQGPLRLRVDLDLGRILNELDKLQLEIRFPRTLVCTGRSDLTLEELSGIASQLKGRILIDHSLKQGNFQLRLLGLGTVRSLEALISQLRLRCEPVN
jgi:hypothetical protein